MTWMEGIVDKWVGTMKSRVLSSKLGSDTVIYNYSVIPINVESKSWDANRYLANLAM